jgi:transposase InsO family protein
MNSITQDMKYRQSLIHFALKYGVQKASRRYNKSRSFIYFWLNRYDGTLESLACRSRRPHSHPNQHTQAELALITRMKRRNPSLGLVELWCRLRNRGYTRSIVSLYRVMKRMALLTPKQVSAPYTPKPFTPMTFPGERIQMDVKHVPRSCRTGEARETKFYQYTAMDEFSRLRFLEAFDEISTYSSAQFLRHAVAYFKKFGFSIHCVQTDNGPEFTNRLIAPKNYSPTLFEATALDLGIRHKTIRPFTPRHNGKVERSHREDVKRFYSHSVFYSFSDFKNQLIRYNRRSNKIPMRPLGYLSPSEFLSSTTVQYV